MRVNRNRDGESTWRRRRTVAAWLAGIAMPAFVAAQAVEDDANGTTAAGYAEPKVESVVQTADNATARTECLRADSLSAFAEEAATTKADPNDAATASDEPQAGTDVPGVQRGRGGLGHQPHRLSERSGSLGVAPDFHEPRLRDCCGRESNGIAP